MSTVKIKRMSLHYFKGIQNREINFADTTIIKGPNGSGKSTIADAFTWLLFGKNMAGESDTKFLIKTVDENGKEIEGVDHEVVGVLMVDDKEIELRRVLVPEYGKDGELKGNHTDYYYNALPVKKSEYDAKVRSIIDESVFKLITSPFAFLTMDWKKQREMLVAIAGEINESVLTDGRDDYKEMLTTLADKDWTLEEYKNALQNQINRINEKMVQIQPRIDEVSRSIPELEQMENIEAEKAELQKRLEELNKQYSDACAAANAQNGKKLELLKEIGKMEAEILNKVNAEQAKEREQIRVANSEYDSKMIIRNDDVNGIEKANIRYDKLIYDLVTKNNAVASNLATTNKEITDLRQKWMQVNATEFSADEHLICPLFKTACCDSDACNRYDQEQGAAFESFCQDREKQLAEITDKGKELAMDRQAMMDELKELEVKIELTKAERDSEIAIMNDNIKRIDAWMRDNPRKPLISKITENDIPECVELRAKINQMQAEADAMNTDNVQATAPEGLKEVQERIESIKAYEAKVAQKIAAERRIEELEEEGRTLGEQKMELEQAKALADAYEIAKMELVSDKVNGMFEIVKWQLFSRQVNGEIIPDCKALVNGVRWSDANTASRINAGIDVAATLAKAYGCTAPMFIDNSESVGKFHEPNQGGQTIFLEFDKNSKMLLIV